MRPFGMSSRAKPCGHEGQSVQYHTKGRHESLQIVSEPILNRKCGQRGHWSQKDRVSPRVKSCRHKIQNRQYQIKYSKDDEDETRYSALLLDPRRYDSTRDKGMNPFSSPEKTTRVLGHRPVTTYPAGYWLVFDRQPPPSPLQLRALQGGDLAFFGPKSGRWGGDHESRRCDSQCYDSRHCERIGSFVYHGAAILHSRLVPDDGAGFGTATLVDVGRHREWEGREGVASSIGESEVAGEEWESKRRAKKGKKAIMRILVHSN
ncbi:hypothetical protein TIFTF001_009540 [Ficus carica]|uniref:Uncharacterized protein n=1 Tax=Ficus carica TaxID=3494 RepID=A0AA87ZUW9_FICCA|nr:hypothetical protein TIFTF001_009540 [Ficus carica]